MDRAGITNKTSYCWNCEERSFDLDGMLTGNNTVPQDLMINPPWMTTAPTNTAGTSVTTAHASAAVTGAITGATSATIRTGSRMRVANFS